MTDGKRRPSTGWIVAIFISALGLGTSGFVLSAFLPSGTGQGIVSGLASAFVSVGLALFISEVLLRPMFSDEVREAAGLSERARQIGFIDIRLENKSEHASIYRAGGEVWVAVRWPKTWIERDLDDVVYGASVAKVAVNVAFPEPGTVTATQAASTGTDPTVLEAEVNLAVTALEKRWRDSNISNGSKLTIHHLSRVPTNYFASNSTRGLLGIETTSPAPGLGGVTLLVSRGTGSELDRWIDAALSEIKSAVVNPPVWVS